LAIKQTIVSKQTKIAELVRIDVIWASRTQHNQKSNPRSEWADWRLLTQRHRVEGCGLARGASRDVRGGSGQGRGVRLRNPNNLASRKAGQRKEGLGRTLRQP